MHTVAAVIDEGALTFDLAIPCEVFGLDRTDIVDPWYEFVVVAAGRRPVRVQTGFTIDTPYGLEELARADTIVVPGWSDPDVPPSPALVKALRTAHGRGARVVSLPSWLTVPVQLLPGVYYPAYRLSIIAVALLVAALLYIVVMRTRIGMLIRAGASNREMIGALGINIKLLFTLVFGLGAALAGLAGLMQAPILTVQIGMGENILILAFVIIVIGGIGSIRGAFMAAIFVGMIDTLGRAFLPDLLRKVLSSTAASTAAPAISSMLVYLLMAIVLVVRPEGLFPAAKR